MQEIIEICFTVAPLVVAVAGCVTSAVTGLSNRKTKMSLTVEQQKNDLRSYMIKRCEVNELFAPVVRMGIKDKATVSAYKKSIVLNDCTIYAKASNYTWYSEEELSKQLDDYISSSNVVTGKVTVEQFNLLNK